MKNKIIGIVGSQFGNEQQYLGLSTTYASYFGKYGIVKILLPQMDIEELDLLVLPGGNDINSARYNQPPHPTSSRINPFYEFFDEKLLPKYVEAGTPIFGICRGMQDINVFFGGSLNQNISWRHGYSAERTDLTHGLQRLCGPIDGLKLPDKSIDKIKVNSMHHQAVELDILGEGIEALFLSDHRDGKVEVLRHVNNRIYGVQWHPEEIDDSISRSIIKFLLNDVQ